MDVAVIVGDAVLAAGAVSAAVVGRRAIQATKDVATEARDVGERNNAHLAALRDESMGERIRDAVQLYAAEHPHVVGEAVMYDAMRDLLDAIISANLPDDDRVRPPARLRPTPDDRR